VIALEEITIAMRMYSRDSDYDKVAARAALRVSSPELARASLARLLEIRDSGILRLALARICINQRDTSRARDNLTRVLDAEKINPEAAALLRLLGG